MKSNRTNETYRYLNSLDFFPVTLIGVVFKLGTSQKEKKKRKKCWTCRLSHRLSIITSIMPASTPA